MLKKVALFTHPTPARRDALFSGRRSRIVQKLNVGENLSEVRDTDRVYPFTQIHSKGERPYRVRFALPRLFARCGLARDKVRPRAKSLSWQTQGGWVK